MGLNPTTLSPAEQSLLVETCMKSASVRFSLCIFTEALLIACTTVRAVSLPLTTEESRRLNESFRDRDVELGLSTDVQSSHKTRGREVILDATSVEWTDAIGGRRRAPLGSLLTLRHLSAAHPRAHGFWEGAGVGLLAGAVGGAAIGFAMGDDPPCTFGSCSWPLSRGSKAGIGGFIGALVGAGLGGAIGAAIGHHDEVHFTTEPR